MTQTNLPPEWDAIARKVVHAERTRERVLLILQDIQRRAHDAMHPLEAIEETINIEELAGHAVALLRADRKGGAA